jgi:integrase
VRSDAHALSYRLPASCWRSSPLVTHGYVWLSILLPLRVSYLPIMRIFEACGSNIADLGEEHGHRVLRMRGKGSKVVLVPLPPAVARAIDRAVDDRAGGPVLRNTLGARRGTQPAIKGMNHRIPPTAVLRRRLNLERRRTPGTRAMTTRS